MAALVVPLTVIPGTFGFDSWPSSPVDRVTEQQIRVAPPKVDVVAVRPRRDVPARHPVLVAARRQPARPAPTLVAVAPAPRRTVVRVTTPRPAPTQPSHPHPAPTPAPQQPAAPPPTPQEQPSKDEFAGGDVPVARELPPQEAAPQPAPQPAPEPVQQPVERVAAPEPCHGGGHDHGQHGDGDSQQ